jgi:hypothetical protein
MESNPNLPAERVTTAIVERSPEAAQLPEAADSPPLEGRQNVSVALLPLALVAFITVAIVVAAWTFLAAAGAGA